MTVLAAIDGEHVPSQTLVEADRLARQFDDTLVALHVMPQDVFDAHRGEEGSGSSIPFAAGVSYGELNRSEPAGSSDRYTIEDGERDAASAARDVVTETLDDWDDVEFRGLVGDPVTEILDETKRCDARYVVIGGRKRSSVGKAVFGSATQSILLQADRPVLVVMR
jgi:nucleotide-binding universal stress UspA family protein